MRHHLNRRVIFSAAIAALAASPALSHAATINQTFDAGPGDFVAGPGGPANYGWLNEDLTLGTSGPGEIGGTMTQTPTEV